MQANFQVRPTARQICTATCKRISTQAPVALPCAGRAILALHLRLYGVLGVAMSTSSTRQITYYCKRLGFLGM